MKKRARVNRKIPRYRSLTFLLLPFIIYTALNFSLVGTVFLKEIVTYGSAVIPGLSIDDIKAHNHKIIQEQGFSRENEIKSRYAESFIFTTTAVALTVFLFNLPFKIFFHRKRRGRETSHLNRKYTQLWINFSPEIITAIVTAGIVYLHHSIYVIFNRSEEILFSSGASRHIFIVSLFTSALVILLIYFGQKFRVQTKYIDHVYTEKRLHRKPSGFNFPGLRGRFFITTIFITFIPLVIVLFYVLSSFKTVESLSSLTDSQFDFLFKDWIDLISMFTSREPKIVIDEMFNHSVRYIDSFGVFQLLFGVVPGLFFSIVYIFQIVSWSNISILKPVNELLSSMNRVAGGDLNSYTIVRSREETGQLSYGFNQMVDGLKEREKIKSLFGQYLSAEISEEILKGNVDLNGSMYQATILFADIRGFTALSESITPHETITFLNDYYNIIIDVIHQYGGIVDKFMGDGILVLFGIPVKSDDHAERAVEAAFEIDRRLEEFNRSRGDKGLFTVKIGIGIHTGEVIAGNIGNSSKLEYTVIGDTVNAASRIESLTKKFETKLLIGESVYNSLSKSSPYRKSFQKVEGVVLRGKKISVNLMKLV